MNIDDIIFEIKATPKSKFKTYFFKGRITKLIKIGKSYQTNDRFPIIQANSPDILDILLVLNKDVEKILHDFFNKYRHHNEWFKENIFLTDLINILRDDQIESQYNFSDE